MANLLKSASNLLFGSNPSGKNPYQQPNLDFLKQPAATTDYSFLTNPDYSKTPGLNTATSAYDTYIKDLQAPSSTDQVRQDVNNQTLQNTLADITRTTRGNLGTDLMSSFSKGLYDPQSGADSDIARIGQAQVAAEGGRTAANAYTTLAGQNLDLEKQRETALATALGSQASSAASKDQVDAQLYAQGLSNNTDAENKRRIALANALTGVASASADSANKSATPGLLQTALGNVASAAGSKYGSNLGGAIPIPT